VTMDHVGFNTLISQMIESPYLLIGAALVCGVAWLLLDRVARAAGARFRAMWHSR